METTSGVLVVGPPVDTIRQFGADVAADVSAARRSLLRQKPSVLVLSGPIDSPLIEEFCEFVGNTSPHTLWILEFEQLSPSLLLKWTNRGQIFDFISSLADPDLESKVRNALAAADEIRQKQNLLDMVNDQGHQLQRLTTELEARVDKRQRTLRTSLRTLNETKTRLEAFHKALLGIHRATTILQMETALNQALLGSIQLQWVRVRFESQSLIGRQREDNILVLEIPLPDEPLRGEVVFAKNAGQKFTPTEIEFLQELSEALALALSRLNKLDQAETLKAQWQATFDSIPHSLCITTSEFEILKLNRAFQEACQPLHFRDLIGKNCFQLFFGHKFQPPAHLNIPFTFRHARSGPLGTEHYEIIGESLGLTVDNQNARLILLRSITEEVRFERRLVDAAKLAELGTIGSSIAHELNNPLGGMLSYLQLILMDMKANHPLHADIKEMESAVYRCRDIILNLLSFARKQDLGEFVPLDLGQVVDRAIKLIELQSKSKGIRIDNQIRSPVPIHGSVNALSQAFCNLLQNSIDSISDKLKLNPLFPGQITIHVDRTDREFGLSIVDNGTGIPVEIQSRIFNPLFTTRTEEGHSGMGLTTAYMIFAEHHWRIEVLSQNQSGATAIVTIPAL